MARRVPPGNSHSTGARQRYAVTAMVPAPGRVRLWKSPLPCLTLSARMTKWVRIIEHRVLESLPRIRLLRSSQGQTITGANIMQSQTLKQEALESLQQLPDDADIDEIMYRLYVVDKIRKGREAAERGDVISHEDLKREIKQW